MEKLDVDDDDSDLPSLSLSLLRPCSLNSSINTTKPNQIVTNKKTKPNPQSPPRSPPSLRRRIPGPAGVAQAAMDRRRRRDIVFEDDDVSTQECVRRAVEKNECGGGGGGDDGDDEFSLWPWKRAIEFLNREGRLPRAVDLTSVRKFRDKGKVDLIVVVIKSCTPNGLGDLMVTLKDPTGIVEASIHHKVFVDWEFGKEICVGSVLILQNVAIFAPSRSVLYLNITQNNVVKVISKDSGPPTKENTYISPVKLTSGHYKETSDNVKEVSSIMVEMNQGISNGSVQFGNLTGSVYNKKEMGKENNSISSNTSDGFDTSAEKLSKKLFSKEIIVDEARGQDSVANLDEGQIVGGRIRANGTQKEKETLTATTTLPEWTDEQLNELFTAEYADGDYSF